MIFSLIDSQADKHKFAHLLDSVDWLEGKLFWAFTQYIFHDFEKMDRKSEKARGHAVAVSVVERVLGQAGYVPEEGATLHSVATELIGVVGRHSDLNLQYRGAVAALVMSYDPEDVAKQFPLVAAELDIIVEYIEHYDPLCSDDILYRLINWRQLNAFYNELMQYVGEHSVKLISRQARFLLDAYQYKPADLMDEVWSKTMHTFFRMCVVGNDIDHIKQSVYSSMHSGVRNMIAKHTSEHRARFKGRKLIAKDEAKYQSGYTVDDLRKSNRTDAIMQEVRFCDLFKSAESEQDAMGGIAGEWESEARQRDARILMRSLLDNVELLPKQVRFLELVSGEYDPEFSAFITQERDAKRGKAAPPAPLENDAVFERAMKTGVYTAYIGLCAKFLNVSKKAALDFLDSLKDWLTPAGSSPLAAA